MKGLLIKSGERAQGRLILLLIRPDKAGTGPERGVPEPTAPVSCSPAQNRQHSQVSAGCLAVGPGATTCLPASSTREAEGGPIPWGWGGSWVRTPDPGPVLRDGHTLGFQQNLPQKGRGALAVVLGKKGCPLASSILGKRRRRNFCRPAWRFAPGPTTKACGSWARVKWEQIRKAPGTTLCQCISMPGGTSLQGRLSHTNGILLAACCLHTHAPRQLLAQAYF